MFVTPAYAQAAGGQEPSFLLQFAPMILIFVIIYFLMIRPQQRKAKEHQAMITALRRGDIVITSGGLIAKVTKVMDGDECEVEIAEGVRVRLLKGTIGTVRSRTEPVSTAKQSAAKPAEPAAKPAGGIMSVFKKK